MELLIKTESDSSSDPILTEVEKAKIIQELTKSALNHFGPLKKIGDDPEPSFQKTNLTVGIKEKNASCCDAFLIFIGCKEKPHFSVPISKPPQEVWKTEFKMK